MDTVYLAFAIIGGTFLVGQFLMSVIGFGHDTDCGHDGFHAEHTDHDHGSSWFAGVLSLRAITAAVMLFGLCGLWALSSEMELAPSFGIACLGGFGALFLVARLMNALHGLAEEGNVKIERSVGRPGVVYLTIPANRANAGKVHLRLQNRTVEYQAVTAHPDPLPTGSNVTVVSVINSDTVEVVPEMNHHPVG